MQVARAHPDERVEGRRRGLLDLERAVGAAARARDRQLRPEEEALERVVADGVGEQRLVVAPMSDAPVRRRPRPAVRRGGGGFPAVAVRSSTDAVRRRAPYLRSMVRDTFAARAARWSATHRKTAVLGWLAFVVIALRTRLGGRHGHAQADGQGQRRVAGGRPGAGPRVPDRARGRAGADPEPQRPAAGSEYRAAVDDLVARLSRIPAVARIASPLQPGNEGQRSKDGTAALVTFQITGDPDTAKDRVAPALAATAAVQRPTPACSSASSATRVPTRPSCSASSTTSSGPR